MSYYAKILSGSLNGVEYALANGDTVFHIGSHRDLVDGKAASLLGSVDNAFYLPEEDLPPAAFVMRVLDEADDAEGSTPLRLGERDHADQPWRYRPIHTQAVVCAAGVYLAVRAGDEAWAQEILEFVPPMSLMVVEPAAEPERPPPPLVPPPRRRVPLLGLALFGLAAVALATGWFYWQYTPDVRVRGLATVLRDAPVDYQILPGKDGRLYAFTEDANGRAWGERASRRLQRQGDRYLLRREEAAKLEQLLVDAGLPLVVVRLDDPAQPQAILSGAATTAQRERVRALLEPHIPYAARPVQVSAISDAALIALAQADLRGLGISSRAEPLGQRVSVVNDVFLDDAGLNAMARNAERFHRQWGQRRITIHLQLWDDLLQGRSYQYSPGQLLSVGEGRWKYARAAPGGAPAAPDLPLSPSSIIRSTRQHGQHDLPQ